MQIVSFYGLLNVLPLRRLWCNNRARAASLQLGELILNNSVSQLGQIHMVLRESFKLFKSSEMAGTITAE